MAVDLVLIDWVDATYDEEGWKSSNDGESLGLAPIKVQTVGFRVGDEDDYVTVIQTLAKDDGYMNRFTIPRGCIQNIQVLKTTKGTSLNNLHNLKAAGKKS